MIVCKKMNATFSNIFFVTLLCFFFKMNKSINNNVFENYSKKLFCKKLKNKEKAKMIMILCLMLISSTIVMSAPANPPQVRDETEVTGNNS